MEMKKKEDNLHAVWFAAGTAALMACLKRAAVVEQWRVWVFLALNLLLLAILFSSTFYSSSSSSSSNCDDEESDGSAEFKINAGKKRMNRCRKLLSDDEDEGRWKLCKRESRREVVVDEEEEVKTASLSKEELNERVEAFIAMFRQHLISDAKGNNIKLASQTTLRRQ